MRSIFPAFALCSQQYEFLHTLCDDFVELQEDTIDYTHGAEKTVH